MTGAWIVILNWNGREDTLALLRSLERADCSDATTLVVDNGSHDGSVAAVRQAHPRVQILENGANLGYAAGNNRGIELALECGADVIAVLNNDTTVDATFWSPLVGAARQGNAAISPDIRYHDDPSTPWFFGASIAQPLGTVTHLQGNEQPPRVGTPPSDLLSGCCLVADAATWRTVGGFDERYFLIFEDSDWSMRARQAGVRLLLEPRSRVLHKVSRSFEGQQQGLGLFYFCRNGLMFALRWLGPRMALRFAWRMVLRPGLADLVRRRAVRPLLVRCAGLAAAILRRHGPAGVLAERTSAATPRVVDPGARSMVVPGRSHDDETMRRR